MDPARAPAPDAAREKRVRMTRLRQTIARRLKDEARAHAALIDALGPDAIWTKRG